MKYIANKHGPELLGTDAAMIGRVEMVANQISELKGSVTMPCYTTGDRTGITTELLKRVGPIVNFLGQNKFLCGDQVTYPDFIFFELIDFMALPHHFHCILLHLRNIKISSKKSQSKG